MYRSHVLVCGGTGCTSSGSQQIMVALREELKKQGLDEEVSVVQTGCHGLCALGPIMIVYPDATFYAMVKEEDIPEIVEEHLLKGRPVQRLLYDETVTPSGVKSLGDTDFYKKQHRIALRNCGVINPEVIEEHWYRRISGPRQGFNRDDSGRCNPGSAGQRFERPRRRRFPDRTQVEAG